MDLEKDYDKIELDSGIKTIGNPIGDYFGYDIDVFNLDNSMRLTPRVVEYREAYSIIADRCGYTAKKFNNKSCTMDFIEHVNPDETTWEKFKDRFVLNVSDTSRIDSDSFFLRTKQVPAWNEVKMTLQRPLNCVLQVRWKDLHCLVLISCVVLSEV
jgi:hypothetical protein